MPSTGPIPKCSLVGVYNRASVEDALSSADLWAVVKLRRSRTSGSVGVHSKGGMVMREFEGATILKVRKFDLARLINVSNVAMLSCKRGS